MYDVIIIGTGPAGMTAAIYSVRREMKTLIIGKELGGQVSLANEIENYPGFENIKSFELIQRIKNQVINFGAELKQAEVVKIEKTINGHFIVYTSKDKFEAKTVIVTIGLYPRRLAIPGEIEFAGHGISYCANCDGPFFRDKVVVVVGGGNSALDAAEVMSKIAKKVYLVHRRNEFRAFEGLIAEVENRDNIEILYSSKISKIDGNGKVEKMIVHNIETEQDREYAVDGVFIEIGRIANTDIVSSFVNKNKGGEIIINDKAETKTPGLFAAGDVTNTNFKQITIAMGQATIAALNAYQYIQLNNSNK